MSDLHNLSVPRLLELFGQILEELRQRGVVRSSNNPICDYAEWLVARSMGLSLESNSQKGYDATDPNGIRY
jgi:hypothetical protein